MDRHVFTDVLGMLTKIEDTLKSSGQLIIEMPPELAVKSKVITSILSKLQGTSCKLLVCASHLESLSVISQSLQDSVQGALGITLSSPLPPCINCSAPSPGPSSCEVKCEALCKSCTIPYKHKISANPGIISVSQILTLCKDSAICPHFFVKNMLIDSSILLCTQSLFFRKANTLFSHLESSIILFEEAINLDSSILDSYSSSINLSTLSSGLHGIEEISEKLRELSNSSSSSIADFFYESCKAGNLSNLVSNDWILSEMVMSSEIFASPVPGNLRRPHHFMKHVKTAVVYLRQHLRTKEANVQSSYGFLYNFSLASLISAESMQYFSLLLNALLSLLYTAQGPNLRALRHICDFCSALAIHPQNYSLIFEPYPTTSKLLTPVLQLSCNDSSKFLGKILGKFSSALFFTSSCSPVEIYCKTLGINTEVITLTSQNSSFYPMILTRGSDQLFVSTKFEEKSDDGVMRNYGELLLELSDVVPDGIVAFFPEWSVLEKYVMKWNETAIIYRLLENRIVLIESPGVEDQILVNFKKACASGRGAVILAVSRGKIANDLQVFGEYVKCTVLFGIPQPHILSRVLKARLCYLKEKMNIEESEYLNWDAMRQAIYCGSQALRGGARFTVMILADKRYDSLPKKNKLPRWIYEIVKGNFSLSTDSAKTLSLKFLKSSNKIN